MARKKKAKEVEEKQEDPTTEEAGEGVDQSEILPSPEKKPIFFDSALIRKMQKDYGASFAVPLDSIDDRERGVIRTRPSLDLGLSGGLQTGTLVMISGPPKCGKTTLCWEIAANFQSLYPDRFVVYYDIESRVRKTLTDGIKGLDQSRIVVVGSTPKRILSGLDYLDAVEKFMREHNGCFHIIDSLSALAAAAEINGTMYDKQMGALAAMLSKFCHRNAGVISVTNSTVVCLNQVRANMNGRGTSIPGGYALSHQVDTDLRLKLAYPDKEIVDSKKEKIIGHNIAIQVNTTTLGPPCKEVKLPLIYGKGIPIERDIFNVGVDLGIIGKSGTWFSFGEYKAQGAEGFLSAMKGKPELFEKISESVNDFIYNEEEDED